MDAAQVSEAFSRGCRLASRVMADAAVAERWADASALGGFTVGGVAGHLYGAVRRFEVALDEPPADAVRVVGLTEFYGQNRVGRAAELDDGLHALIREDGERRAQQGPQAVIERFSKLAARLDERLPVEPSDRLVPVLTVPDGATPLASYLATRVVELVVHSDDLAVSARLPPVAVPEPAGAVAIEVFAELARARAGDLDVIRAFARRERGGDEALRVL